MAFPRTCEAEPRSHIHGQGAGLHFLHHPASMCLRGDFADAKIAMSTFGSIDGVVNSAGIFFSKPFTDYTSHDFAQLSEKSCPTVFDTVEVKERLRVQYERTPGSVTHPAATHGTGAAISRTCSTCSGIGPERQCGRARKVRPPCRRRC
jgi:hypothetical protein